MSAWEITPPHLEKLERTVRVGHLARSDELQQRARSTEPVERLRLIVPFGVGKLRTC